MLKFLARVLYFKVPCLLQGVRYCVFGYLASSFRVMRYEFNSCSQCCLLALSQTRTVVHFTASPFDMYAPVSDLSVCLPRLINGFQVSDEWDLLRIIINSREDAPNHSGELSPDNCPFSTSVLQRLTAPSLPQHARTYSAIIALLSPLSRSCLPVFDRCAPTSFGHHRSTNPRHGLAGISSAKAYSGGRSLPTWCGV